MGDKEEGRPKMWPPAAPAVMHALKTRTFVKAAACWPATSAARAPPVAAAAISMGGKGCGGRGTAGAAGRGRAAVAVSRPLPASAAASGEGATEGI
jgi:hypothetical protein